MSFTVTDLDHAAVQTLLSSEESYVLDLKAVEVEPSKLTRSMSGFCNADGGELFVGVDEDRATGTRTWRGFTNVEESNGHLQAFDSFFPLGQHVEYEFLRQADDPSAGLCLKATLRRTPDVRRASDGKVYVRRGAQNLPQDAEAVLRFEYRKGTLSFETHPLDVPLEFVTNSETLIGFMLEIVPKAEPSIWLPKQLLIRDGKPIVAAVLLFADEPQAAMPKQSAVKVYRYATTDESGSRSNLVGQPMTVEGNAYQVIRDAVRVTVDQVQGIRLLGSDGLEAVTYPEVALHEIITNSVLHRDYSIADDIHVRIFDNRIEVESPGGLPQGSDTGEHPAGALF